MWGLGLHFCLSGFGLAMEDAGWDAAPFLCFGLFDAPGQGRRPAFAAMRPVALHTLDLGKDRKGHRVRVLLPRGLAAPHKGGKEALPASDAEPLAGVKVSKFAGATRECGGPLAPGLIERSGYRAGLGAGRIRPHFRCKERLPPEGGFP